jgi:glycosyltransferase involved in cell wall biosynthesis
MRVLHLTRTTVKETVGGLEHHIAYLTEALRNRGHDVDIVRMRSFQNPDATKWAKESAFPNVRLGSRLSSLIDTVWKFALRFMNGSDALGTARRVNKIRPDIVHQHSYIGAVLASLLLSRKYPVVFTNHTGAYLYLDRWKFTRGLQRQLMKLFTAVIAPSRELLPATSNSHYIPNGVDTRVFHPVSAAERVRIRKKWDCEGKLVFLCPRRWAPTKGIIFLAKALEFMSPETRRKSVFIFAGNETAGYAQYQQTVRAFLGRVENGDIRVLGNVNHDELAELMNAADVCVIPSLMEATSLACLEAMACGTVVLGTATGGLAELIQDGRNGWLVPPGDVDALLRAIEKIAGTSSGEMEPMRAEALALVRGSYTWDIIAERTEGIYSLALQSRRPKRAAAAAIPATAQS